MREEVIDSKMIEIKPNYLWFLTLAYSMVIVLANWFDPRLIKILGLTTDAGTLIFPFTFLLSDLITEVYGYKQARQAIWCGFFFNAVFILYGQLVIHMPSPDYPTNNIIFDTLLAANTRIIIASALSYFSSEPLNSAIMAKLKIKMNGRFMSIRFIASTIIASGIDSVIFCIIAFYGILNNANLSTLIIAMWFIKILIEVVGLPLTIRIAKRLKQREKLDIYDTRTNFNLFDFDASYTEKDNKFNQKNGEKT